MSAFDDPTLKGPFIIINRAGPAVTAFVLPLQPQEARTRFPSRGAIKQTPFANWLDDFSGQRAVLVEHNIRGTFGYKRRLGGIGLNAHGSVHLKTLETIYETFNALDRQLKKDQQALQEYVQVPRLWLWRVWIKEFEVTQRSSDPLLYYYRMQMFRIEDYLSPVGPSLPPGVGGALDSLKSLGGQALGALF